MGGVEEIGCLRSYFKAHAFFFRPYTPILFSYFLYDLPKILIQFVAVRVSDIGGKESRFFSFEVKRVLGATRSCQVKPALIRPPSSPDPTLPRAGVPGAPSVGAKQGVSPQRPRLRGQAVGDDRADLEGPAKRGWRGRRRGRRHAGNLPVYMVHGARPCGMEHHRARHLVPYMIVSCFLSHVSFIVYFFWNGVYVSHGVVWCGGGGWVSLSPEAVGASGSVRRLES